MDDVNVSDHVTVMSPKSAIDVHQLYPGSCRSAQTFSTNRHKLKIPTIVHFKRLGSRVSHDSFNQYVFFFSKQCTYCTTNAIYT